MYHLTCAGGYALPVKKGKFEVVGFSCPASSTITATEIALVDQDPYASLGAALPTDTAYLNTIIDKKGTANYDGNVEVWFPESIKVRNGLALSKATNLLAGKILVYVK